MEIVFFQSKPSQMFLIKPNLLNNFTLLSRSNFWLPGNWGCAYVSVSFVRSVNKRWLRRINGEKWFPSVVIVHY